MYLIINIELFTDIVFLIILKYFIIHVLTYFNINTHFLFNNLILIYKRNKNDYLNSFITNYYLNNIKICLTFY